MKLPRELIDKMISLSEKEVADWTKEELCALYCASDMAKALLKSELLIKGNQAKIRAFDGLY